MDENTNEALVFKNIEDKYVNIEKKDLYSTTMKKLKNILVEMSNNIIDLPGDNTNYSNIFKNTLKEEINGILRKYNEYEDDHETRNKANSSLEKVFINKKNDAEQIAIKITDGY
jgi:hypothetical protein